jgi:uncharacterized protein YcbK (DUF882 family)
VMTRLLAIAALLAAAAGTAGAQGPTTEQERPALTTPTTKTVAKSGKHKKRRGPAFSGRLASASELRDEALDKPSGHIELYAVNFRENLEVDLYGEDGALDQEALDQLNHLWRCKRTDTEKAINPRLFEMLSRIWDHFGKRIELVSGFRNQKRTSSFHFHGSASDIRIPGVSDKELHKFVTSLDAGGMGIGIYPRAGFVHVDIRPEPSYRWTDWSGPGQESGGHAKSKRKVPNT